MAPGVTNVIRRLSVEHSLPECEPYFTGLDDVLTEDIEIETLVKDGYVVNPYFPIDALDQCILRVHPDRVRDNGNTITDDLREDFLQTLGLSLATFERDSRVGVFPTSRQIIMYPPRQVWESLLEGVEGTLVTPEEREQLRNLRVFGAGLSVGAGLFTLLAARGIGAGESGLLAGVDPKDVGLQHFRLNHLLRYLGIKKATGLREVIKMINPYAKVDFRPIPLTEENIESLAFAQNPHILVDAVDTLEAKELMHQEAKAREVPVLMVTNLGSGRVLVNFYDYRDPETSLFNMEDYASIPQRAKMVSIVGIENIPPRMMEALKLISQGLMHSFPQEAGNTGLTGAVGAYFIELFATGHKLQSETLIDLNKFYA